jgi:hypothetical protein
MLLSRDPNAQDTGWMPLKSYKELEQSISAAEKIIIHSQQHMKREILLYNG